MNKHDVAASNDEFYALKQAEPSLPARWYHDAAHYKRELGDIWYKSWVYVCRESDLADRMSYRTIAIGDQNIVVLRSDSGEIRAFYNSCRHRGSILCTGEEGRLKSKLMVCPYHQWAYAADDGRLVKTSSYADPPGFNKDDYALFAVNMVSHRGMIFVNLDKDAVWDEATAFQRDDSALIHHPLQDMITVHRWRKVMACNWKTFWENFNECLHCPNVHPELCDLVPMYSRRIVHPRDLPGWEANIESDDPKLSGGLRHGGETWSSDGSAQGHIIPSLSPEDLARGQRYDTALPSMFIGGYADHARIVRLLPLGPEETELTAEWLLRPETANDESYDPKNIVDFAKLVMQQDLEACELNQRGLHAAPLQEGVLMPEEYYVKMFQDWVRERLSV